MNFKKRKVKKLYTSGPVINATNAQAAQELWVSVMNFDHSEVKVEVEVLNWGDPAVSSGLVTTPAGMAIPMKAMAVPVMPAEQVKVPAWQTQHFFADLLTGAPLAGPVLSFEIRVTVITDDPQANVVFNAAILAAEAEELPEAEEADEDEAEAAELTELVAEEEEEEAEDEAEAEAAASVTAAFVPFKDFVLLELKKLK
ncbi:hypothetical protein [Domibacillus indicus]|uniref:hypothetical protein n=1 Tax=Domibacillus indicus TaxID=1437523 RepID=UPI000617D65C|nr:hypothetical protein [Domibacillus indicus]